MKFTVFRVSKGDKQGYPQRAIQDFENPLGNRVVGMVVSGTAVWIQSFFLGHRSHRQVSSITKGIASKPDREVYINTYSQTRLQSVQDHRVEQQWISL